MFLKTSYGLRKRIIILFSILITITIIVWVSAIITYKVTPFAAVSLLVLSYTFGLRHALDADHIAAIDNITRRFLQDDRKPVTIGLYFSLGHSTIVIIATIMVAIISTAYNGFQNYSQVSGTIGSSISAGKRVDWDALMNQGGFFCRLLGQKMFKLIDRGWKIYTVGLLFGLGFDTATEIILLALVVIQNASGHSTWIIVFLAFLFTCGMVFIDSLDAVLMLGVYSWAFISPLRKLYYNLLITTVSFLLAISIAIIEILGVVQSYSNDTPFWDFIGNANDNFFYIGTVLVAVFFVAWISTICYFWFIGIDFNHPDGVSCIDKDQGDDLQKDTEIEKGDDDLTIISIHSHEDLIETPIQQQQHVS